MDAADAAIVRRTLLFGRLDEDRVADLVGTAAVRTHPKGELLFQEGETVDDLPIVLSGWVRLFRTHLDGGEATVRICGPATGFMEAAVLLGRPADLAAETIAETRILRIDGARLRRRLASDAGVAFAALASASLHLRHLVADLEKLRTLSAPRRIARFILDTVGVASGPAEIRLPYEKALIAGHIGMTAESFSRGLAALRAYGVTTTRERLGVERLETLSRLVDEAG